MERGLYIAASGMLSEMARQDLIANDLANAATPGYKADRTAQRSFDEILLASKPRPARQIGTLGTGVTHRRAGHRTSRPRRIEDTGEPLDFAIAGEGFFAVQTAEGVRYTRNGRFTADGAGHASSTSSATRSSAATAPVPVGADGTVDPAPLATFTVPDARKAGDGMFTGTAQGPGTGRSAPAPSRAPAWTPRARWST